MGASGRLSGSEVRSRFGKLVVMIWRMRIGKAARYRAGFSKLGAGGSRMVI